MFLLKKLMYTKNIVLQKQYQCCWFLFNNYEWLLQIAITMAAE